MSALKGPCPFQFKLASLIQKTRQMHDCSTDSLPQLNVITNTGMLSEQISCSFFEPDVFCVCQMYWQTYKHTQVRTHANTFVAACKYER